MAESDRLQVQAIRKNVHGLTGSRQDYDLLMELAGDCRFALLGEASHGTHEFYQTRAEITKRLIEEKGYSAVAVEADWPDAHRVNRYVQGRGDDANAAEALSSFKRFPTWMWRNTELIEFITWLRKYNDSLPEGARKVGFYGLDLYSLHASARFVLDYLEKVDPEAARRARYRYSCFEHFGENTQAYGYAASFGLSKTCEDEVVSQLVEMQHQSADLANRDGHVEPDEFFVAEQNARLVKNAERYYRAMFESRVSSWNLRDQHMVETLDALVVHLGASPRIAVWAHNSHLGDARATEMRDHGELNVGQLVRERYGKDALLLGFTTYTGSVTAASDWDGPVERKTVRPALSGSYEALFHETGVPNFLLTLRDNNWLSGVLNKTQLERAIGVIYLPETELASHYFEARLADQFDAVIHLDETRAVEPLERTSQWEAGEELPETFPFVV
jgi:erythromycin esterase-like protein